MADVLGSAPPQELPSARTGVVVRGVRRAFGPIEAVRGIDLTAPAGEVTALVGPNGAGKTTLLLVLATLLVPDAGEVSVAGFDPVTESDAVRARMGWAPDVFGLYDNLTAREYLEFVGDAYRLGRTRSRARAGELLTRSGSPSGPTGRCTRCRAGRKQRLGMARALVHDPQVLLLDEPASGLDPRSRVELRDRLRELAAAGVTVLVSSHLLGDLEELADRVVFVDGGATVGEHRLDQLPVGSVLQRWRVRALDTNALVRALEHHAYDFEDPTAAGVDVHLAGDDAAAALLAGLVGDGVPVVAFQPLGGRLEAAYLALTEPHR